jgi:hypothetical protein
MRTVIDCGPSALSSPPVFLGVMQTATVVTFEASRAIIGVRFKPGGALPFVTSSVAYATEHHPVGFMQYDGSRPG